MTLDELDKRGLADAEKHDGYHCHPGGWEEKSRREWKTHGDPRMERQGFDTEVIATIHTEQSLNSLIT